MDCWTFDDVTESLSNRNISYSLIFAWCVSENENNRTKENKFCILAHKCFWVWAKKKRKMDFSIVFILFHKLYREINDIFFFCIKMKQNIFEFLMDKINSSAWKKHFPNFVEGVPKIRRHFWSWPSLILKNLAFGISTTTHFYMILCAEPQFLF